MKKRESMTANVGRGIAALVLAFALAAASPFAALAADDSVPSADPADVAPISAPQPAAAPAPAAAPVPATDPEPAPEALSADPAPALATQSDTYVDLSNGAHITVQPLNASYSVGDSAAQLFVDVSSVRYLDHEQTLTDMKFTWYLVTTTGLTKVQEQVGDAGRYYLPSTDTAGDFYYCCEGCEATIQTSADFKGYVWEHPTDMSEQALITVGGTPVANLGAPTIDQQPVGATYHQGKTVAPLSVSATAADDYEYSSDLTYQWYRDGAAIDHATEASYTPDTTTLGTSSYYCVVSQLFYNSPLKGSPFHTAIATSATATIETLEPNVIIELPEIKTSTVTPISSDANGIAHALYQTLVAGGAHYKLSHATYDPEVPSALIYGDAADDGYLAGETVDPSVAAGDAIGAWAGVYTVTATPDDGYDFTNNIPYKTDVPYGYKLNSDGTLTIKAWISMLSLYGSKSTVEGLDEGFTYHVGDAAPKPTQVKVAGYETPLVEGTDYVVRYVDSKNYSMFTPYTGLMTDLSTAQAGESWYVVLAPTVKYENSYGYAKGSCYKAIKISIAAAEPGTDDGDGTDSGDNTDSGDTDNPGTGTGTDNPDSGDTDNPGTGDNPGSGDNSGTGDNTGTGDNPGTDTGTDTDNPGTGGNSGTDSDSSSDANDHAGANDGTNADADAGSNANAGSDTDANTGADASTDNVPAANNNVAPQRTFAARAIARPSVRASVSAAPVSGRAVAAVGAADESVDGTTDAADDDTDDTDSVSGETDGTDSDETASDDATDETGSVADATSDAATDGDAAESPSPAGIVASTIALATVALGIYFVIRRHIHAE